MNIHRNPLGLLTILAGLGTALPAFAGPRYFKAGFETLEMKACTLQAQGSLAAFNSSHTTIKAMADAKKMVLESFFSSASSSYGRNDVEGASTVLKNEARMN